MYGPGGCPPASQYMVKGPGPFFWRAASGMSSTAIGTGGHTIGTSAGEFSMLAAGTTAPTSNRLSPCVLAHVHTCALLMSAHAPFTSVTGMSFEHAPTMIARSAAPTVRRVIDMRFPVEIKEMTAPD